MTGAPDIPPEASGESPQGIAAFLASVVGAAGEMATPSVTAMPRDGRITP